MATLVLTTVGGAVAGPVGAALGALAGRRIDGAVLGRGRREGPRLAELRVQASSYGATIPKLFGTVRVAGTVIWSTDLTESRAVTRAKGAPDVARYSCRASFAVLLSARPIRGVARVWADGNLLRGAAGDLKAAGRMRVHLGGEAQRPDPLIASAEGAMAPAHRGCAYVVFEDLALADFGNRIPSLSFEVEADAGGIAVGAAAKALAAEVDAAPGGAVLGGFAAGDGAVRATLELLAEAGDAWFAPAGGRVRLAGRDGAAMTLRDEAVAVAGARASRRSRSVAPVASVPQVLTLGHYDPARDYQAGVQRAVRAGAGTREERVEMPAVLPAPAAKTMAAAMLARAEAGRTRRTLSLGIEGLAVVPGGLVTIAGEAGLWRVEAATLEGWATVVTLVPLAPVPPVRAADPGRVVASPDRVAGRTILHIAELPALDDRLLEAPRLVVVACGEGAGWRGAALLVSADGGASWQEAGGTAAPGVVGSVEVPAPPAPATLVDRHHAIVVRLTRADLDLGDADVRALDAGANLALIGDELVQFGRATPLGEGRWRLSELWRGRRGTEGVAAQRAGDRFVLLDPASIRTIDLPASAIGTSVAVMASGIGDPEPARVEVAITGRSVAPPSPVSVRADRAADGAIRLRWTRRSRLGWRWLDGADAPLGEERERYRVTLGEGGPTIETDVPAITVPAGQAGAGPWTVTIVQQGTLAGSPPARIVVGG